MRRLQGIAPRAALSGYKEATMGKRGEKRERRSAILEPDAAGIDIGAEEIYVAVPPDRDEQATRRFSSFTCDLYALAEWLECSRIRTVAMESTAVYWIFQLPSSWAPRMKPSWISVRRVRPLHMTVFPGGGS